jgi:hypothetical protein
MKNCKVKEYLQSYCIDSQYCKTQDLRNIIKENPDSVNVMEICYHSDYFTEIVLDENKQANITSFDTIDNSIKYSEIVHSYRNNVITGNTKYTLLKFIENYPLKTFDIIFIQRIYKDYNDVVEDLNNCFLLANQNTIIIIETDSKNKCLKTVWKENVLKKKVSEIYSKFYNNNKEIIVGKFLFN